jgi:hypothetical protein
MTEELGQFGCQTDDMKMIHKVFRREFGLAPPMVRHVAAGDTAQAGRVTSYLDEIVTALHHHHQNENRLLWDTMVERAPACALHVGQMKQQHAAVATLLDQVPGLAATWTAGGADEDSREQLAVLLDEISALLNAHLGQEEEEILPIASTTFTQSEWDRLREEGMASVPKNRLLVQLGYILEDANEEERKHMLSNLPVPAKVLYKLVGRRKYEKEIRSLRAPV